MKALKKRPVAILVCVSVIALSTIYSAHRTLGAKVREVNDGFYSGVFDREWSSTRPSVHLQLEKRCESAKTLASLAENHIESNASDSGVALATLRSVRENLLRSRDIPELYDLNKQLDTSFYELCEMLEDIGLSERDSDIIDNCKKDFRGAQSVINASGYNESVRALERTTLEAFPANILKKVAFIPEPALFE